MFRLLALLFLCGLAYADWHPDYIEQSRYRYALEAPGYQNLKSEILSYLYKQHSGFSEEKVTMLMDLTILEDLQNCVEIGVFKGWSFLPVAATLKYMNRGKITAIDAFSNTEAIRGLPDDNFLKAEWARQNMKKVYGKFQELLTQWDLKKQSVVLKEPSATAAKKVDEIDFIHIDGNYSEEGSLEDVRLYLPKVKKGGYVFYEIFRRVEEPLARIPAFQLLLDECIIVAIIDNFNGYLLKKC